jgi:putative ABC transport system permease protein
MSGGNVAIEPEQAGLDPLSLRSRFTSADMVDMFDMPFRHGGGWNKRADDDQGRVAVISADLNEKLFAGEDSVGRSIRLNQHSFEVVGVLDQWRAVPRFYDLTGDRYGDIEQVFLPFSTAMSLEFSRSGNMDCWGDDGGDSTSLTAPCVWMQFWVELADPGDAAEYERFLTSYAEEQRAAGRFERPTHVKLRSLMEWLDYKRVVPNDVRLQTWLAFGFLLVCLLNTVGLLLAKFLRRSGEIGVRRALGASRSQILVQYLVEAGVVGLAGGLLGLVLAWLGLWAVRQQPASYAELAYLDPMMLGTTFALAIAAGLLAGVLPAWHAGRVSPAIQLKSQ